ncbi:MAG: hypothetical protein JWN86_2401 [Planctomycetota bacterium]|nr:hypothetical protein [Planctomycetota bacterium]
MARPSIAPVEASPIDNEPVIENEIPAYRAISPLALTSAGLGVISALSFTDLNWLAAAALAVITGVWADRKIRRRSDAMTGRSYAHAGIALGLMFGVSAFSYSVWSLYALERDARKYGAVLEKSFNDCKDTKPVDTGDILWYMIPPTARRGMTPEEVRVNMKRMPKESEKFAELDSRVRNMIAYADKDPIKFIGVESAFFVELDAYAMILLKLGSGEGPEHKEDGGHKHTAGAPATVGDGYALIRARGKSEGRRYRWWIDGVIYPYSPKTYEHVEVKADGGHGHSH